MLGLARRVRYKLFPPPIMSPYLYMPGFAKALEGELRHQVCYRKARNIVEFGCLHGFSTAILADATMGTVVSYDIFDKVPKQEVEHNLVKAGLAHKVWLGERHIDDFLVDPDPFDLLYIDVRNTEEILYRAYYALFKQISSGIPVLFEGAARIKQLPPHKVLCPMHPGLGLMV